MRNALIGYTGFVGETLLRQHPFEQVYRSTTIREMTGGEFDLVVCAGAPAKKWIANRDPVADRRNIDVLIDVLRTIRCNRFVLISTVDVFRIPREVDESVVPGEEGMQPYGRHRRILEHFAAETFPNRSIVRLPGLVGPGLRKNVVFDLLNGNGLDAIDSRAIFQFYPIVNLWYDIRVALEHDLQLVHLTAEPVSVAEVAADGFGRSFVHACAGAPPAYDMQTQYASLFGGVGRHQYRKRDSLMAIRTYAQSESQRARLVGGATT